MWNQTSPSLIRLHAVERSDRVSTYNEVATFVNQCRSVLKAERLEVKSNSALGSLFRKADRLNKTWIGGTDTEDVATLIEAGEAYRIAEAVATAIEEPDTGRTPLSSPWVFPLGAQEEAV